eukprot:scaffold304324_cov33-Tisochrysis_lutea.AAC.1
MALLHMLLLSSSLVASRPRACRNLDTYRASALSLQFSTGLTFDDGEQILISAQKPLGLLLEEVDEGERTRGSSPGRIVVAGVDEAGSANIAGVREGDVLLAVNNQDMTSASLEAVMERLAQAPRVVNLRFRRTSRDGKDTGTAASDSVERTAEG